jgi:hypothetical protein
VGTWTDEFGPDIEVTVQIRRTGKREHEAKMTFAGSRGGVHDSNTFAVKEVMPAADERRAFTSGEGGSMQRLAITQQDTLAFYEDGALLRELKPVDE